ncbi:peroxiredoxin-like family protein [Reichenbachiella agariperforans]|uniref:peroxiredoxin-like family protein n=1 Tax=Reichenbachiella agariperforans TaxID=156994 RepID=UPI001C09381B|nr:peroxiredoxin-like family protein [Reichenbachiella agariperforans]MBU2916310.1 AhpC/TSA family protein [Reichenbachiella agariperforans]
MSESLTLAINTLAPTFDLTDIFDRRINLKDYRGKRVMVGFFRHAGCPFCNIRIHRLQKKHAAFKALGLEMIFFFESEEKVLKSHEFHVDVNPIPLISDPDKIWYQKYGIESSGVKSAVSHVTSFFQTVVEAKMKGLPVHMMEGNESIKTIPAEFLIDDKGMVRKVHYARSLTDRMKLETISKFAETGNV